MDDILLATFKDELVDLITNHKICKECYVAEECSEVYTSKEGCPAFMRLKRMIK